MKSHAYENSNLLKFALLATLVLSVPLAELHAQSSSSFSSLQEQINKQVTVETADGQVTGQLLRAEEGRLVINQAGSPKSIPREAVRRVTKHKSKHTVAWVVGMSAAGVGTGFLLGLRAFDDAENVNTKVGASAGVGAGAGAALGYALSRIGKSDKVIFQSE